MRRKTGKPAVAAALFVLILTAAGVLALCINEYVRTERKRYALITLGVIVLVYVIIEILEFIQYARYAHLNRLKFPGSVPWSLVLLNDEGSEIKHWDLRNKSGLVIGRDDGDAEVEVDLSDTEYFSLVSHQHAVMNFSDKCWYLSDAGSRNGTSVVYAETTEKLLLASGEPVPIRVGDRIYIAGEIVLAAK